MWEKYRTLIFLGLGAIAVKAAGWIFDQVLAQVAADAYAWLVAAPYIGPWIAAAGSWIFQQAANIVLWVLSVIAAYALGKISSNPDPDFIVERISTDQVDRPQQLFLTVRNIGKPFENHIVKLTNIQRARDGSSIGSDGDYPQTMRTVARQNDQLSSRFLLSANEPKQVLFCGLAFGSPVIQCEASDHVLVESEYKGYIATVELFGRTSSKYLIWVGIRNGVLSASILSPDALANLQALWPIE